MRCEPGGKLQQLGPMVAHDGVPAGLPRRRQRQLSRLPIGRHKLQGHRAAILRHYGRLCGRSVVFVCLCRRSVRSGERVQPWRRAVRRRWLTALFARGDLGHAGRLRPERDLHCRRVHESTGMRTAGFVLLRDKRGKPCKLPEPGKHSNRVHVSDRTQLVAIGRFLFLTRFHPAGAHILPLCIDLHWPTNLTIKGARS